LGPEGGDSGGEVLTKGTPEQVSESNSSYTGKFMKKMLNNGRNDSQAQIGNCPHDSTN
jgi:excinuclease ABC subunit A